MTLEIVQRIDEKVGELYDSIVLGTGKTATGQLEQRLAKLEGALYSGSGQGIVITSCSIAQVLQSTNFVEGSAGWRILKSGICEFEEVTVRGTIHATAGDFLGAITIGTGGSLSSGQTAYNTGTGFWLEYNAGTPRLSIGVGGGNSMYWDGANLTVSGLTVLGATITGSLVISTGGSLSSGQTAYNTGTGFWMEYNAGTPRFSLGVAGGAGFTWDGAAMAVNGAITATSGTITGTLYVGAAADRIVIDGSAKLIMSENYTAGVDGWCIYYSGTAEFEDVIVRGSIRASVFEYGAITATQGSIIITKSAGSLLSDCTSVTGPTSFTMDIRDPDYGHVAVFATNDIIRLTDGANTTWATVMSVSDQATFYRYTLIKNAGDNTTYEAGLGVVDYGSSLTGEGGLFFTADALTAPYMDIFTHAGAPWGTITTQIRLGNLNGAWGFVADTYGIAIGDYTGGEYLTYDSASGTLILHGAGDSLQLGASGLSIYDGATEIVRLGDLDGWGGFVAENYGIAIGDYAGGDYMYYENDTGVFKLVAAAGAVYIDNTGLNLSSGAGSANAIDWYSSVDSDQVATLYVTEDTGAADTTYYNLIAYPANTSYTQILIQGSGGTAFKIWDSLNIGEASIYHQDAGNSTQLNLGIYYTSTTALLLTSYSDRMIMFEDLNNSTGALVDLVEIRHDTAGTLEIDGTLLAADFFKISTAGLKVLETVEAADFKATTGATINEFSIDHRLSGASETAVPVERAVLNAMTARFQSPTQHFLATPGWTWCGAPFTGTPSAVTYTRFASWQSITHTGAGTFFYYYPLVNPATREIRAYVATEHGQTYAGLRIDDGDDNDYTELVLMPGTTTGFLKIQMRYRNGGGAVTTTDLIDGLLDQPYMLRLYYSDAANVCYLYYGTENSLMPRWIGTSTATWATTANVRAGIYYYTNFAGYYCHVDWLYDGV